MRPEVRREIARLMGHTRRYCQMAVNKRLSVVGSSLHEYMVLFRLIEELEVAQHDIAFDAAIDPASASRLVRDMVQSGLVSTRVDPADKRQRYVRITARGRTLEKALTPVVDAAIEPYMVGLTLDEEDQFLALLRKAHTAIVTAQEAGLLDDGKHSAPPERPSARARPQGVRAASKPVVRASKKPAARAPVRAVAPSTRTPAASAKARRSGGR